MSSYQYRKSHCGDETVWRSSFLHNGISYTGKMSSLYWIRVLVSISIYINFLLYQLSTALHRLIPNTSLIFQVTCNTRYQVPNHFFHNMIGNPTVNDIHLCYLLWMQGNNKKCKACKSKGQIVAIKDQFFLHTMQKFMDYNCLISTIGVPYRQSLQMHFLWNIHKVFKFLYHFI